MKVLNSINCIISLLSVYYLQNVIQCDDSRTSVRLHVFTNNDQTRSFDVIQDLNSNQTISSICNSSKSLVKLITHGFAETWNMSFRWNWVNNVKRELLRSTDSEKICLIAVDWRELAYGGVLIANYWNAISNMNRAADIASEFLNANKVHERDVHCIGFSLGAHMCSILYKTYFNKYAIRLNRITGLDPAGPFFGTKPTSEKLYWTDADFVDIIHTSNDLGLAQRNGHMDFFPDDGPNRLSPCEIDRRLENVDENEQVILYEEERTNKNQNFENVILDNNININDLYNSTIGSIIQRFNSFINMIRNFFYSKPKRLFIRAHQFFGCSHLMAVRYFIHSINDCTYRAFSCSNRNNDSKWCQNYRSNISENTSKYFPRMGYWANNAALTYKTSHEIFYVNTTNTQPYCHDTTSTFKLTNIVKNILTKKN